MSVPDGVTIWIGPVVAPTGTVASMKPGETTWNIAGVPLNVTLLEFVNLVPKIRTMVPGEANVGMEATNPQWRITHRNTQ